MNKAFLFGVIITLLIILSTGGAYYLGTRSNKAQSQPATTTVTVTPNTPTQTTQPPKPTVEISESDIPESWLTYKNEKHGFEISYPNNYKALDDDENLYGWPDAVVLIYSGGQSYDLPIEVWNSASEYETKYPNAENLIVKKVGDKYITLMNVNYKEEIDAIIETFKLTN